jgi:hypothetical protein
MLELETKIEEVQVSELVCDDSGYVVHKRVLDFSDSVRNSSEPKETYVELYRVSPRIDARHVLWNIFFNIKGKSESVELPFLGLSQAEEFAFYLAKQYAARHDLDVVDCI